MHPRNVFGVAAADYNGYAVWRAYDRRARARDEARFNAYLIGTVVFDYGDFPVSDLYGSAGIGYGVERVGIQRYAHDYFALNVNVGVNAGIGTDKRFCSKRACENNGKYDYKVADTEKRGSAVMFN